MPTKLYYCQNCGRSFRSAEVKKIVDGMMNEWVSCPHCGKTDAGEVPKDPRGPYWNRDR